MKTFTRSSIELVSPSVQNYKNALSKISDEIQHDMKHHAEIKSESYLAKVLSVLPDLMLKEPEKFPTDWNRPLTEDEINEIRSLASGIRLKPFNPDELSLIEKRDLFVSNTKSLIEKTFFAKEAKSGTKKRSGKAVI